MHEKRIFLENPWRREIAYWTKVGVETQNRTKKSIIIRQGEKKDKNQIRNVVHNFLKSCN